MASKDPFELIEYLGTVKEYTFDLSDREATIRGTVRNVVLGFLVVYQAQGEGITLLNIQHIVAITPVR